MRDQKGQTMFLAIVFSFPRATLIWGLLLLASQAIFILFREVSLSIGIVVCIMMFAFAMCTGWALYPSYRWTDFGPRIALPNGFLSWLRRVKSVRDIERQD